MDARIETARFSVQGMDCASCATKVDTAARRIKGVQDVSVSVMAGIMSVQHDLSANVQGIAAKVSNLGSDEAHRSTRQGHSAKPSSGPTLHGNHDHDDKGSWWKTRKAVLTATCAVTLAAAYLIGRAVCFMAQRAALMHSASTSSLSRRTSPA